VLNQRLTEHQDFYLTFNCHNCGGIYTSVVEMPNHTVQHECPFEDQRIVTQEIEPKNKRQPIITALQIAVV